MTAPVYEDLDQVEGLLLSGLISQSEEDLIEKKSLTWADSAHNTRVRLARTASALWRERDKARNTAAMQDAAIHSMQGRLWALTKLRQAIKVFQERGYESGFPEMNEAIAATNKAMDDPNKYQSGPFHAIAVDDGPEFYRWWQMPFYWWLVLVKKIEDKFKGGIVK